MRLFKVSRTDRVGYDQYSAIIVAAVSSAQARLVHPRLAGDRGAVPSIQYRFVSPNGGLQPINPGLPLDQWPKGRWFGWGSYPGWDDENGKWHVDNYHAWTTDLQSLKVEQIGVDPTEYLFAEGQRLYSFVILASFNAG